MKLFPRFALAVVVAVLAAAPVIACPAYYSGDQCEQIGGGGGDDQNDGSTGDGSGGGGRCPYYMCGNAMGGYQDSWGWCEATQTYENCPIFYCQAAACVGTNCYPTTGICSDCSSRTGNNVHISSCPR
jgi:hypothetical protein